MLGLRKTRVIPETKVTSPEELEREIKITKIKEINRLRQPSFQIEETASALRGFAREFGIQGIEDFGAREFMRKAKPEVLKLVRENRQTRMRIVLNCEMIREELFSKNAEFLDVHFQRETFENLEGADESDDSRKTSEF